MPEGSDTNGIGNFLPTIAFRIFCQDGPFEAKNSSEDVYGLVRLYPVVSRCEPNLGRLSKIPVKLFFSGSCDPVHDTARFYRLIVSGSKRPRYLKLLETFGSILCAFVRGCARCKTVD